MTVLVIAEAGVNHNGDIGLAVELIHAAAYAGADIVKFQTFSTEKVVCEWAGRAPYQVRNAGDDSTQADLLRHLELDLETFLQLRDEAQSCGLEFLSTAFDIDSLEFLVENEAIRRIKIPSGEVSNLPFLFSAARLGLPVIMSTGMSYIDEVVLAIDALAYGMLGRQEPSHWRDLVGASDDLAREGRLKQNITLLQCTTEYPALDEDLNLRCISTLRDVTGLDVGYSDHSQGMEASIAAVALGAQVVEKHLTLDRDLPGPDHRASMEPEDFRVLVEAIHRTETMLGSGVKKPAAGEEPNRAVARRSLTATAPIASGERFSASNLGCKRPGEGLPPREFWTVLGHKSLVRLPRDGQIAGDSVELNCDLDP